MFLNIDCEAKIADASTGQKGKFSNIIIRLAKINIFRKVAQLTLMTMVHPHIWTIGEGIFFHSDKILHSTTLTAFSKDLWNVAQTVISFVD